jgi:hypothetical protein
VWVSDQCGVGRTVRHALINTVRHALINTVRHALISSVRHALINTVRLALIESCRRVGGCFDLGHPSVADGEHEDRK